MHYYYKLVSFKFSTIGEKCETYENWLIWDLLAIKAKIHSQPSSSPDSCKKDEVFLPGNGSFGWVILCAMSSRFGQNHTFAFYFWFFGSEAHVLRWSYLTFCVYLNPSFFLFPFFFFFFFFLLLCILISHLSFTSHYSSLFFLNLSFFLSFFLCLTPASSLHLIAVLGFYSPRKRMKLRQAHWDLFASLNFLYLFLVLLLCITFFYLFPVFLSCIPFLYFFSCIPFLYFFSCTSFEGWVSRLCQVPPFRCRSWYPNVGYSGAWASADAYDLWLAKARTRSFTR